MGANILLAAWLGAAALFAAVVAPAAFAVLPERALAGALVGRVLPVLFVAGIAIGLAAAWLVSRSPVLRLRGLRRALCGVQVAACAMAQFALTPRIERLRAEIGPSLEALTLDDARRFAFGRLHAMSVGSLGVAMVAAGAALLVGALVHRPRGRSELLEPNLSPSASRPGARTELTST
jgi:hypothetical protein